MSLRVLIADDDPATAAYLKKVIEEVPGVAVVSTVRDGEETIRQVEIHRPDVVFLDIDMPGMNGLDAARELAEMRPGLFFVFATAFPEYALDAFELYSFDYILKPFDETRIRRTVRRLRDKVSEELPLGLQQSPGILIEVEKQKIFINPEEILYAESRRRKVLIKTEKGEYLAAGDLNRLEQKLNPRLFFRCHKGYLVNLKRIKKIIPSGRSYDIILDSGDRVFLSREREKELRERFALK
ncbi:MAG TPA: response regulator transcription factor [Syntrophomonadaceae bacterium]|nr:response regulator transcription factor [Syntrophomonadaceae bacterium]